MFLTVETLNAPASQVNLPETKKSSFSRSIEFELFAQPGNKELLRAWPLQNRRVL